MNCFIIIITVAKCAHVILYSFLGPLSVLERQLTSCFLQAAEERPGMPFKLNYRYINPAWNLISTNALSRTDISSLMKVILNKNNLKKNTIDVFFIFFDFCSWIAEVVFFFFLFTCVSLSLQQPFYFHKEHKLMGEKKKNVLILKTDV